MALGSQPTLEDWQALAERELRGRSVEDLTWRTPEGIAVKPLYTPADLDALSHCDSLPGIAPFVRGPRATMYAGRPWTIRQYAGFSTAKASNAFYRRNLAADDVILALEVSEDLHTWSALDAVLVSSRNNGDGTSTESYRAHTAPGSAPRQFLRLTATTR